MIEIGDGFRIPDIMARSGAALREVGTTNRTRIDDYRAAINDRTRLLLRVHPSNFRITGFTARPELRELAALGRERGIPVYEDLGSGCVVDLRAFGIDEPLVSDSLSAGADLVSFSGDKLLGGPQAGILAGRAEFVARLRRNPLFRALRLDKMIYQALENTLRNLLLERWDDVPALAMIRQTPDQIRRRAEALLARVPDLRAEVVAGQSVIGGGATPEQSIPTWLIAVECAGVVDAERRLRAGDPPVVARIEDDRLIFDLRTVFRRRGSTRRALRTCNPDRSSNPSHDRKGAVCRALRPFLVGAFGRVDANLFAFGDERRHLHHQAGFQSWPAWSRSKPWRPSVPGSVSTTSHVHRRRQFHADRLAFVELHRHLQLRNQVIAWHRPAGPSSGASARRSRCS